MGLFTRDEWVGSAHAYRTKINWPGVIFVGLAIMALIGAANS